MFGAKIIDVDIHCLPENKALKKGYRKEAVITLTNVSDWCDKAWEDGWVYGPLREFAKTRDTIKKLIKDKL